MDSKCHHMHPCEKEAEEHLIHTEKVCEDRTEKDLKMSTSKTAVMQLQSKETDLQQRLEGASLWKEQGPDDPLISAQGY